MKETAYEGDRMMFSERGKFATFGRESYRQGLAMVASAGDEAIYRARAAGPSHLDRRRGSAARLGLELGTSVQASQQSS